MNISYILPIKWDGDQPIAELTGYLTYLSPQMDLIIVDGSLPANFERHHRAWARLGKHIKPHVHFRFLNGKVNGVLTGILEAKHHHVVIADDDVRYELHQVHVIDKLLADYELVSPQNYFQPCPWHAKWDTSRSLLNLTWTHDYPGTLAVQRAFVRELGGYDGDVLFENLELIRTVRAGGGTVIYQNDLFIRRVPPSDRHFWSQRIRQAYDDFAQPARMSFFIILLPLVIGAAIHAAWLIPLFIMLTIAVAEIGRRKHGGQRVIALSCSFCAPLWLIERAVCTWLALFKRLVEGGIRYNSATISKAANTVGTIRRRLNIRATLGLKPTD